MKNRHYRIFNILLMVLVSFLFAACTREAQKSTSQVTIRFPNSNSFNAASVETGSKLVSGKPSFDYGLIPANYSQVDCLIVFIGGPEELMNGNSCEKSLDKSQSFRFGVFAGAMSKENTVSLEVPSGPSRYIRLYGMKKPTAASLCPGIVAEGGDALLSGFSAPFFLGESKPTEMLPGGTVTVEIPIVAEIDPSAYFDDCKGPKFGSGNMPGGGSSDPSKPYLRIEGLHNFNKIENPSFARPMARGACYPVAFKTYKPCNAGVCEAYTLQNSLSINMGLNIKIFTSEGDCQNDTFAVSTFNILSGQSQIPVTGNYYLRIPLGQFGMTKTDLSSEISISGTTEVNFNQPSFTNIDIVRPKIVFSNLPGSISYGSCASGTNTSISVYEDFAATIPMISHQVLPFDGLFLMAKNLGCSTVVNSIPANASSLMVNLAKPIASSSGITGSVVNTVVYDSNTNKYYIAGLFSAYGGKAVGNIIRLNPDGSHDPSFDSGLGFDGPIKSIIPDGAGGVFVGGSFLNYKGISVKSLAKLDQNGKLDLGFGFDFNGTVNALNFSGSSLYVGGTFTQINGLTRNYIASIDLATKVVTSWDPNFNNVVSALFLSGTTLYIGGNFTTVNGATTRNRLAAIDSTTGIATGFNPNMNNQVSSLIMSGTTLYVGGSFTTVNGATTRNRLAAIDSTTGIAVTFNPNMNNTVRSLALSGTTLYVGGSFTTVNGGTTRNYIAAVDTTIGTASSWNPNITGISIASVAVNGANIVGGGTFTQAGGLTANNVAAVNNSTGSLNPSELNPYWGTLIFNSLFYEAIPVSVGP